MGIRRRAIQIDKRICRYCRLSEPQVLIRYVSGVARGECHACRNEREKLRLAQITAKNALYKSIKSLLLANHTALASLPYGTYALLDKKGQKQKGFVALKDGAIYISVYGENWLFRVSFFGVATFLSDMGLVIDAAPFALVAPDGAAVELADIGRGLLLQDVADKIAVFNGKVADHAYKRLKQDLANAKAEARGYRRKTFNKPIS